ncbi:hypothetical protein, partial [Caballeronia sp. RCC_10]|uniref:hypothetical protein n=1 Tax=Caballeronia sp. RCC_10 TaxID=3239227 RepID=UPI003525CCFE
CSSVNRLFFMTSIPPLEAILSSFNRPDIRQAAHFELVVQKRSLEFSGSEADSRQCVLHPTSRVLSATGRHCANTCPQRPNAKIKTARFTSRDCRE